MGSYRIELLLGTAAGGHFEQSVYQKHRDPLFTDCISCRVHELITVPIHANRITIDASVFRQTVSVAGTRDH